jgi:hypothetical protein
LAFCLLLFGVSSFAQSQPHPQAEATISGKVRWKDKGVPDCQIFIWSGWSSDIPQYTMPIKTDREGTFRRSVRPGNYQVWVSAPAFYVLVDGQLSLQPKRFTVDAGAMIDDLTFDLERGGVVTGKVTLENKPVIDINVSLVPVKPAVRMMGSTTPTWDKIATDDRGVYRFYGIPPGEYKVVAGEAPAITGMRGRLALARTFFPDLTEEAKAKTIVVESAKEVTDIDIKMSPPVPVFTVRGVVVDEESGAPLDNARVGLMMYSDNKMSGGRSGNDFSDRKGRFFIENVAPGRYAFFITSQWDARNENYYGQSEQFEVTDHDIEGFVFKTKLAASVAGRVVIEGSPDAQIISRLKDLSFFVSSIPRAGGGSATKIFQPRPDGTFLVRGLTDGTLNFQFVRNPNESEPQLIILRAEHEGKNPIEIKSGDNLTGIKLVLVEAKSSLRGRIQFADGLSYSEVSGSAALYLDKRVIGWGSLDRSGNFLIENVPAGSYRLVVNVGISGSTPQSTHNEQPVELTPNQVSQVTVWLSPQPLKPPGTKPNQR